MGSHRCPPSSAAPHKLPLAMPAKVMSHLLLLFFLLLLYVNGRALCILNATMLNKADNSNNFVQNGKKGENIKWL